MERKKLAIIGASGHGKVVAEIAELNGYTDIVFLDDNAMIKECGQFPVCGMSSDVFHYIMQGYSAFVAIGNGEIRKRLSENIVKDKIVTLVHPSAVVSKSASIGCGSIIMAGSVINAYAKIGNGCIVNTCASVDHDNEIENYTHIAVGAHLAGHVHVGAESWIGAGATVSNDIYICPKTYIGAGAVVVDSIMRAGTYVGCPARKIK